MDKISSPETTCAGYRYLFRSSETDPMESLRRAEQNSRVLRKQSLHLLITELRILRVSDGASCNFNINVLPKNENFICFLLRNMSKADV